MKNGWILGVGIRRESTLLFPPLQKGAGLAERGRGMFGVAAKQIPPPIAVLSKTPFFEGGKRGWSVLKQFRMFITRWREATRSQAFQVSAL